MLIFVRHSNCGTKSEDMQTMKRFILFFAVLMTVVGASAYKDSNIKVWGEVTQQQDGQYYLTMYKNCPAQVTARFHFKYKGGGVSQDYDLFMADTVAVLHDPVPVEREVRKVVVEEIIYSACQADGERYYTDNPNDRHLIVLLANSFDLLHDVFWFNDMYRASYYDGRYYPGFSPQRPPQGHFFDDRFDLPDNDIDLTELDDNALLLMAGAVVAAGIGMGAVVSKYWNVPDNRYPYFSITPQVQYFIDSGLLRNVMQFKYRFGNKGGCNVYADLGYASGTMNEKGMFDPGVTCSFGAGLDLGNFSMSLGGKPAVNRHGENFLAFQLGYDAQLTSNFGLDLKAGAAVLGYKDEYYLDYPISVGLFWRF